MTSPNNFVVLVRNPCALESGMYPVGSASCLIWVLVAEETSGSSRRAFETVMTDTPASWAMSLRRTMFFQKIKGGEGQVFRGSRVVRIESALIIKGLSKVSAPPMQFAPHRFQKRAVG